MTRIVLAAALLTGCAATREAPAARACDAKPAQILVGRERADRLLAEAKRLSGADEARFLLPGQIVTMEYKFGRVNVSIDEAGKVSRVNCG